MSQTGRGGGHPGHNPVVVYVTVTCYNATVTSRCDEAGALANAESLFEVAFSCAVAYAPWSVLIPLTRVRTMFTHASRSGLMPDPVDRIRCFRRRFATSAGFTL